jgi:hypothetical protein
MGKFWQFLCLGDKHQACLYTLYPLRDTFLLRFYWIFTLWAWKVLERHRYNQLRRL